jgi:hypothetical protein
MEAFTRRVLTTLLTFLWLATFGHKAQALSPAPEGCYPNFTTAEGCDALFSLTTGVGNSGLGWRSLFLNTTGSFNTGVGGGALVLNNADSNTAVGAAALLLNTTGTENVALGTDTLVFNDSGSDNSAIGTFALMKNITGYNNTAVGFQALYSNTEAHSNTAVGVNALAANVSGRENTGVGVTALSSNIDGEFNTATGYGALTSNIAGSYNTANGIDALRLNTTGSDNTAVGDAALFHNTEGNENTALGEAAGFNQTTGSGNVYIGTGVPGVAAENNHTYISNINATSVNGAGTDTVTINLTTGLLGHLSSSQRYKEDIRQMDRASETLYRLKPVTYRFKKEIDATRSLDYGLVAEDVARVDPNLAIRNGNGEIESVRYSAINAMLLNEFLKEHRKVQEQEATITELKNEVATVVARLKEQDSKIERVSAQLEISRPGAQVVQCP